MCTPGNDPCRDALRLAGSATPQHDQPTGDTPAEALPFLHEEKMRFTIRAVLFLLAVLLTARPSSATVLANVRGVVHDPQHRPLAGAQATLQSSTSSFHLAAITNNDGAFEFSAVPLGEYRLSVSAPGFAAQQEVLLVASGAAPVLHFQLALGTVEQQVNVTASAGDTGSTATTQTIVSRRDIARYAGADSTNSLKLITGFVPGAYMVHDQLHVRGGHQVSWAIDGVPIPNTNIASNVGPQFNPRDVDYLEAQRGGYSAEYGDRSYAVFNVATRTGFERNREAELALGYGSYNATDDHLSFGDHSEKFAWYASANGNRSDYGLEPPTSANLHNQQAGGGAFTSLIYNATPADQLRLIASLRADYYQVPNDPDAQAAGVRDREREQDAFTIFSWVHTFSPGLLLTASPFYHFNRAAFEGGALDVPAATDNRASNYAGGQLSLAAVAGRNNARAGIYAFGQHDNTLFSVVANDGSATPALRERDTPSGDLEAFFLEDSFKATSWLTLNAGLRFTHFSGKIGETAADPRLGIALRAPRLNWVLRASYSRYYQAPPLDTVSGPLVEFCQAQGCGFLPLKGERDEQHEVGLTVPVRGWIADFAWFRNGARNFFDHDVIGNSNLFFPLTIDHARIAGYEATLRSPAVFTHFHAHLAYSNQQAEGFGGTTGGLTDFSPPPTGGFYLDHDQRNTLSVGAEGDLPLHSFAALSINYGSGFLSGNGPEHLPSSTTVDLSLGKSFGESLELRVWSTNIGNRRYQLDTSNTFGGSHYADPRMIAGQLRYRFHF